MVFFANTTYVGKFTRLPFFAFIVLIYMSLLCSLAFRVSWRWTFFVEDVKKA